jgi:hypothetical protein
MRLVRILLVVLAVVAVGLAGWALGNRDAYNVPATAAPAPAASAPAPREQATPDPTTAPAADTTQPAPRPRILGIASEPVFPSHGGTWQLPTGAGQAILWADARNATRVEFLLTPTVGDPDDLVLPLGQDRDGRDGFWGRWSYEDRLLTANLTVRATGPGGTVERSVGVYHPDPETQP